MTTPTQTRAQTRALLEQLRRRPPSWRTLQDMSRRLATDTHRVEGMPIPVPGYAMQTQDHYENRSAVQRVLDLREPSFRSCSTDDVNEGIAVRSHWWSSRLGAWIFLYTENGGPVQYIVERRSEHMRRLTMLVMTAGVTQAWDIDAELRAQQRLKTMVKPHLFDGYLMTGVLPESSPRSGVTYVLRRGFPTIAMVPSDRKDPDKHMRFLTALCMHPLAYYEETFAGAMVPTDDVIAHLLHIRGDEHYLWRKANQHRAEEAESGL